MPTGVVASAVERVVGEVPEPGFDILVEWYRRDQYVRYAVDCYATRVATKFYLTCSEPEPLEFLNRFLRKNQMPALNWRIARDVVLAGNAFLNMVPAKKITSLYLLPLSSIRRVLRDAAGDPVAYEQLWGGRRKLISAEEVYHYRFNPIDEAAFGEGLVNLLTRPGRGYKKRLRFIRRPSLLEVKERIDNTARILIEELAPFHVFKVPTGKRDEFTSTFNNLIPGQHVAVDYPEFEIQSPRLEQRTRFAELWEYVDRQVLTALKNPLVRLITYTGFSRASAEAAMETLEPEVANYQEFLGAEHERMLARVLAGWGWDPEALDLAWNWGAPEIPEWALEDLVRLYEVGILDREEARRILREIVGLPLPGVEEERVGAELHSRRDAVVWVLYGGRVRGISELGLWFLREVISSGEGSRKNSR